MVGLIDAHGAEAQARACPSSRGNRRAAPPRELHTDIDRVVVGATSPRPTARPWCRNGRVARHCGQVVDTASLGTMPSETESLAVQLVRAPYDAPGRTLPMQWHKIEQLDVATADAVEFAAAR